VNEARWEIQDGGRVLGPYTDADVLRAIAGTLPVTTPARRVGELDWHPIGTLSPFAELYMRRAMAAPVGTHTTRAHRTKSIETIGGGCLVQGVGALPGLS